MSGLLLIALLASSADPTNPSLEAVLQSVQRHHPLLEAARLDVVAARSKQMAAEGAFDLYLSAKGSGDPLGFYDDFRSELEIVQPTPFWGTQLSAGYAYGTDQPIYSGKKTTGSAGEVAVSVVAPLWRGGPTDARRTNIRLREGDSRIAELKQANKLMQLKLKASVSYWKWMATQEKLLVAEHMVQLAESRNRFLERGIKEGQLAPIQFVDNERLVVARQEEALQVKRQLQARALELSLYYRNADGRPVVASGSTSSTSLARLEVPVAPRPVEELLEIVIGRRPEVAQLRQQMSQVRAQIELADNDAAPQIDLSVRASKDLGDPQSYGPDPKSISQSETEVLLGVTFSMPVQRRRARGTAAAARAKLEALGAKNAYLREQLEVEIQNILVWLKTARGRSELATRALSLNKQVEAAERRRFSLGSSSILNVNLREEASAKAAKRRIEALTEVHIAHTALRAALFEL